MTGNSRSSRLPLVLGLLIGLLGVAFVVKLVVDRWVVVQAALSSSRPFWVVLAVPTAVVGMGTVGWAWLAILRRLGHPVDQVSGFRAYYVGQLGKYVPGGVWAIMGRGEWVRQEGVGGVAAYSSVALSMGTVYLAGTLLVAAVLPFRLSGGHAVPYTYLILVALPLGIALLHPRVLAAVSHTLERVRGRATDLRPLPWSESLWIVVRQVPTWILIGSATWMVAVSFDASAGYIDVITATSVSWVVGFLFIPVPGGIGIREAAFVATITSLDPGIAATTALTARLVFVAADAIGAGLASGALVVRGARTG